MTFKDELQQTTQNAIETSQEVWDTLFMNRCKDAAEKGRDYAVFGIYEEYKGEFFGEERLFDFAKRHNLIAEKNKIVFTGSTVTISWEKNES